MTPAPHQLFTPSSSASRQPLRLRLPPRLLSLASAATPSFSPLVKPTHHGAACDHMTHRLLKYPGCRRQQVLITEDVARRALWYRATLGERHGCRGARGALTPFQMVHLQPLSHSRYGESLLSPLLFHAGGNKFPNDSSLLCTKLFLLAELGPRLPLFPPVCSLRSCKSTNKQVQAETMVTRLLFFLFIFFLL